MMNGTPRPGLGQRFGEWSRVLYAISLIASIAAAAWYLDDRGTAKAAREASALEVRLDQLDRRMSERMAELNRSVQDVNRRLDRLMELQMELSGARRK